MINKDFLESELKRLNDQFVAAQKQAFDLGAFLQQLNGAIQMTQGLLRKVENEASAAVSPPPDDLSEV